MSLIGGACDILQECQIFAHQSFFILNDHFVDLHVVECIELKKPGFLFTTVSILFKFVSQKLQSKL